MESRNPDINEKKAIENNTINSKAENHSPYVERRLGSAAIEVCQTANDEIEKIQQFQVTLQQTLFVIESTIKNISFGLVLMLENLKDLVCQQQTISQVNSDTVNEDDRILLLRQIISEVKTELENLANNDTLTAEQRSRKLFFEKIVNSYTDNVFCQLQVLTPQQEVAIAPIFDKLKKAIDNKKKELKKRDEHQEALKKNGEEIEKLEKFIKMHKAKAFEYLTKCLQADDSFDAFNHLAAICTDRYSINKHPEDFKMANECYNKALHVAMKERYQFKHIFSFTEKVKLDTEWRRLEQRMKDVAEQIKKFTSEMKQQFKLPDTFEELAVLQDDSVDALLLLRSLAVSIYGEEYYEQLLKYLKIKKETYLTMRQYHESILFASAALLFPESTLASLKEALDCTKKFTIWLKQASPLPEVANRIAELDRAAFNKIELDIKDIYRNWVSLAYMAEEYQLVLKLLRQGHGYFESDKWVVYNAAYCFDKLHQYENAIRACHLYLKHQEQDFSQRKIIQNMLQQLYVTLLQRFLDLSQNEKCYENAIKLGEFYLSYSGQDAVQRKVIQEALPQLYVKLLQQFLDDKKWQYGIAFFQERINQPQTPYNQNNINHYYSLGKLLLAAGHYEEANSIIKNSIKFDLTYNTDNIDNYALQASILIAQKKFFYAAFNVGSIKLTNPNYSFEEQKKLLSIQYELFMQLVSALEKFAELKRGNVDWQAIKDEEKYIDMLLIMLESKDSRTVNEIKFYDDENESDKTDEEIVQECLDELELSIEGCDVDGAEEEAQVAMPIFYSSQNKQHFFSSQKSKEQIEHEEECAVIFSNYN